MDDDTHKPATVTNYRLTVAVAERRVRELAVNSENIKWGLHATERMVERGIFDVDALRVMRSGSCAEQPELTSRGEWKIKMVQTIRGSREVGVIVIILKSNRLFVKTVEWEDL